MRRARASDTRVARSESTHRDRLACAHLLRPRRSRKARVAAERRAGAVPPGAPGWAPHCNAQPGAGHRRADVQSGGRERVGGGVLRRLPGACGVLLSLVTRAAALPSVPCTAPRCTTPCRLRCGPLLCRRRGVCALQGRAPRVARSSGVQIRCVPDGSADSGCCTSKKSLICPEPPLPPTDPLPGERALDAHVLLPFRATADRRPSRCPALGLRHSQLRCAPLCCYTATLLMPHTPTAPVPAVLRRHH